MDRCKFRLTPGGWPLGLPRLGLVEDLAQTTERLQLHGSNRRLIFVHGAPNLGYAQPLLEAQPNELLLVRAKLAYCIS